MAYKCWKSQELHFVLYLIRRSLCDQAVSHSCVDSLLTVAMVATAKYQKQQRSISVTNLLLSDIISA